MSTEAEHKVLFRRAMEDLCNQGNLAVADELFAPDFLIHDTPPGVSNRGPEAVRQLFGMLRSAFPDLHLTIEEVIAEGDTVAGRVTMTGTHRGSYRGMAPTGRSFRQAQMHFIHVRDGKAVELWHSEKDLDR